MTGAPRRRHLLRASFVGVVGLALVTTPALMAPALGSPTSENTWVAPEKPVIKDYQEFSTVTMPSSGAATVFYGTKYRTYNPANDTWGGWSTLTNDSYAVYPTGNARGDLCAHWFPNTDAADLTVGCRRAGTSEWLQRTYTAGRRFSSVALSINHRGTSAMAAWIDYRTIKSIRIKYATFDAASGSWSRAKSVPLASGDGRLASVNVVPHGDDGYALHYVRDVRIDHPRENWIRVATGTWLTTWTPSGDWTQPAEVTVPLGGGADVPVTVTGVTSEKGKVAAIFAPAMEPWWYEHEPWIGRLRQDATYTGQTLGYATTRPLIALSGGILGVASVSEDEERLRLTAQRGGVLQTKTLTAPVVSGDQTRVWGMSFTAQRMSDGAKGWSVALEINRTYEDEASESLEDVQYLYAVTAYVDKGTDDLKSSPMQRVGTGISYDGLSPTIAGNGDQAIILYFQQDWQFVAFRRP